MGYLKINIRDEFSGALMRKLDAAGPRAAHALASHIMNDTEDFVPALNESLSNRAQVVENMIVYRGPYARYLYEGKVMVYKDPPYLRRRSDGKAVLTHYGQKNIRSKNRSKSKKRSINMQQITGSRFPKPKTWKDGFV